LEGALFDGLAVCEGYAKSYLLLLRLEGIESYRVFVRNGAMSGHNAINTQQYTGGGYGSHAYCAIKMADGYFYYSDPESSFVSGQEDLETYHQFMISPDLLTGYIGGFTYMYPDMQFGTDICYIYNSLVFDGNALVVKDKEQLTAVLTSLQQCALTHVQISLLFDLTVYADYKKDLLDIMQTEEMKFNYKEMGRSGRDVKELVIYIESA
jgi:hypothetical protein